MLTRHAGEVVEKRVLQSCGAAVSSAVGGMPGPEAAVSSPGRRVLVAVGCRSPVLSLLAGVWHFVPCLPGPQRLMGTVSLQ